MSKVIKNHSEALKGILELRYTAPNYESEKKVHNCLIKIMEIMLNDDQGDNINNVYWYFYKKHNKNLIRDNLKLGYCIKDIKSKALFVFYENIERNNIEFEGKPL